MTLDEACSLFLLRSPGYILASGCLLLLKYWYSATSPNIQKDDCYLKCLSFCLRVSKIVPDPSYVLSPLFLRKYIDFLFNIWYIGKKSLILYVCFLAFKPPKSDHHYHMFGYLRFSAFIYQLLSSLLLAQICQLVFDILKYSNFAPPWVPVFLASKSS